MIGCNFEKSSIRLGFLCVFYIIYLIIGAAIFSALEYDNEQDLITELKLNRQTFLRNKTCINDAELEAFITRIIEANSRGINAISNLTVEPNWSFGQAVFFAGTVLTTIGYGHVSPLSAGGKIFCIFFGVIGVPMTLIMISACVERLLLVTNRLKSFLKSSQFNEKCVQYTHLIIVFIFVLTCFFLIPAAIFSSAEKHWSYLDALYYCFISLSTIGLGDYIPGDYYEQPYRVFYKVATTVYLIFGVMFVMLLINVIIEIPELNFPEMFSLKAKLKDPERQHLSNAVSTSPSYTQFQDDDAAESIEATSRPTSEAMATTSLNAAISFNDNLNTVSTPTDDARHPLQQ